MAGDVFEANSLSDRVTGRILEKFRDLPVPVYLLPGNHDPLVADSIFRRTDGIEGVHVIVVEDILDSGNTLSYLLHVLEARHPASIKLCTLLDKPERRVKPINADYVGFTVPNAFIVGYGLDYSEKYRNLPYIGILKPEIYE